MRKIKRINILITAGGTMENIDQVRKIANTSTGRLARVICEEAIAFLKQHEALEYQIHYVIANSAIRPRLEEEELHKVIFYEVTDTESVQVVIEKVLTTYPIHYFIHSMAVSDFTTSFVASPQVLAKEISQALANEPTNNVERIEEILRNPASILNKRKKIPSSSEVLIGLNKTPKIIAMIKAISPRTYLVGFKLQCSVAEEVLVQSANELATRNQCDMVIANDIKNIEGDKHEALIIQHGQIVRRCASKKEIAKCLMHVIGAHLLEGEKG